MRKIFLAAMAALPVCSGTALAQSNNCLPHLTITDVTSAPQQGGATYSARIVNQGDAPRAATLSTAPLAQFQPQPPQPVRLGGRQFTVVTLGFASSQSGLTVQRVREAITLRCGNR